MIYGLWSGKHMHSFQISWEVGLYQMCTQKQQASQRDYETKGVLDGLEGPL